MFVKCNAFLPPTYFFLRMSDLFLERAIFVGQGILHAREHTNTHTCMQICTYICPHVHTNHTHIILPMSHCGPLYPEKQVHEPSPCSPPLHKPWTHLHTDAQTHRKTEEQREQKRVLSKKIKNMTVHITAVANKWTS